MGEHVLAAFIQVLVDKLTSPELFNFPRREGLEKKLEKLKETIEAVLADAEEKQLTEKAVKTWLDDLRDLAYDAEDITEEFAYDAMKSKLEARCHARPSKLRKLVPGVFSSWSPSATKFNISMGSKIEDITSRLEGISERRAQLGLESITGGTSRSSAAWQRPPSTCVPTESAVYGREEDKKKIDLLLTEEASDVNFGVVPIVGMGGLGKTTLARLVYNDKSEQEFHPKAWVCVSDKFDVMRLTKAILESVTSQSCDLKEFNEVQVKLREALAGKRFLLVLDDVWNKNYGLWEALKSPFLAGAPGSKIIVTTRDANVALMMGNVEGYKLKRLSEGDCWSVFVKHAFENRDISADPNLESIRKKIVEKCSGLPLAARTLGGLLRFKLRDEWEDILNSKIWNLSDDESDILLLLRLSYYHLPSHLKRCFAYCAIFPKDYEFEEKEVVCLWMAEGLIRQLEGNKQMEELGGEYFRELLSRSIFQASSSGGSLFVMHDLVNDLAQWVAGEACFRLEDDLGAHKGPRRSKRARYSSYIRGRYDGIKKFEAFHEVKCLRTFLPLLGPAGGGCYMANNVLLNLLPKLKKLRVLSLAGYNITELPNSIEDLKHLRYLNLSRTKIRILPESTSSLYNLRSLLLRDCSHLQKLPSEMENLINLLHVDITNANLLTEMPIGIKELKSLRTLSDFVLGKGDGSRVKELNNFKFLRGTLCISNLENVIDAGDAKDAKLNEKQDLDVLVLKWSSKFDDSRNAEIEKDVLDNLRPHQKLKELTIKCYAGSGFPTWLGDPSFSSIQLLRLENCGKCTGLPPLGQLSSLKDLVIKGMIGVKSVGPEFYGNSNSKSFPSLETLRFEDMQEWEDWDASEIIEQAGKFSCLRELSIVKCPKLSGKLPDRLPSLEKLVIHKCEQLVVSISSLPKLYRIEINGREEVVHRSRVDLSSLNSMVLTKISKLICLTEGFMPGLTKVANLEIGGGCEELTWRWLPSTLESLTFRDCERLPNALYSLTSLRELHIYKCPTLISVLKTSLLSTLYKLSIYFCDNLQTLVDDEGEDINLGSTSTSFLEYLEIESCPSLRCLSSKGMLPASLKQLQIGGCPKLESIAETFHNNTSLEEIMIFECENLKSLPDGLHNLNHLSLIQLDDCPSVVCFPEGGLPTTNFRHLMIGGCKKLEALPNGMHNLTSLQGLRIMNCPSVVSFPEGGLPTTNLRYLWIDGCEKLEALPNGMHDLTSLQQLMIWNCPSVVSFPEGGLPTTNLRNLQINFCEKLEALPNGMHNLTSLQELTIGYCQGIVSFPEEGFPTNLTSLSIYNLNICIEWGLHRLTSLKRLFISGGCPDMVSFPPQEIGMMLPTSLTDLSIGYFPNLKYLSSNCFQNLTSLEHLSISDCPELTSLPKEGLPPSLLSLCISNSLLLKKRCKRDKGQDWSKIAHIPCVEIDGKFIYDPEEEE